jgi:hypothetical protein
MPLLAIKLWMETYFVLEQLSLQVAMAEASVDVNLSKFT